ncbi:MAG: DUF2442 domain-containing protein [Fretibacterium sp.]|nr:DUF2442 domain-containing protein [Fretibacterium sp.]
MRMVYDDNLQDYICYADKPLLCVREVMPQADYTLLLTFSNEERRIYDARPLLDYELFSPLKALPFFMQAHCDGCTVIWNDNLDIAPETLYEKSVPVEEAFGELKK